MSVAQRAAIVPPTLLAFALMVVGGIGASPPPASPDYNEDDTALLQVRKTIHSSSTGLSQGSDGRSVKGGKGGKGKGKGTGSAPEPSTTPVPTPAPAASDDDGAASGEACGVQYEKPTSIRDRWLNAHNYWRCIHGSSPICWDADFAAGAQEWANQGQFKHADCYNIPPPQGPAGENLAGGSHMSPEKACDMWHDENPEKGPNCGGHCTAMLWNSATKLGCGIFNDGEIMVCRYGGGNPLPNFGGSSNYKANVGFPEESKEQACSEQWPLGEGILGGGGGGGMGGNGFGGGGSPFGGSGGSGGGSPFGGSGGSGGGSPFGGSGGSGGGSPFGGGGWR